MTRRMEENVYDDLTEERLDSALTKYVVWDGVVYQFDVTSESNSKLDEHMADFLGKATTVEGDDLALLIEDGIGGRRWSTKTEEPAQTETPENKQSNGGKSRRALTEDQVREIRKEYNSAGGMSTPQLAEKYGVSTPTIYSVGSGRSYKDVQ